MVTLIYGATEPVTMDDRALEHLQAVIVTKLRRPESFAFSCDRDTRVGEDPTGDGGRHGWVWVSDASQLHSAYGGPPTDTRTGEGALL